MLHYCYIHGWTMAGGGKPVKDILIDRCLRPQEPWITSSPTSFARFELRYTRGIAVLFHKAIDLASAYSFLVLSYMSWC